MMVAEAVMSGTITSELDIISVQRYSLRASLPMKMAEAVRMMRDTERAS